MHPSGFIEPCLPTPSRTVPDGPRWSFEIKHDGYRFIARRDGDRVRVFSRHGKDWADRVPLIVEAMRALPVTSATGSSATTAGLRTSSACAPPWLNAAARAQRSCSPSTYSRSKARTFAESLGKSGARP